MKCKSIYAGGWRWRLAGDETHVPFSFLATASESHHLFSEEEGGDEAVSEEESATLRFSPFQQEKNDAR